MAAIQQAEAIFRKQAFSSLWGSIGGVLITCAALYWPIWRVQATFAPRCDRCAHVLGLQTQGVVMSSGLCPFCHQPAFTEDGSPIPTLPLKSAADLPKRFLPFVSFSDYLQPKHRQMILWLVIGPTMTLLLLLMLTLIWLRYALRNSSQVAFLDQHPNAIQATLFIAAFVGFFLLSYLAGFALLALVLRYARGWSWEHVCALIFRARLPAHWLKDPIKSESAGPQR